MLTRIVTFFAARTGLTLPLWTLLLVAGVGSYLFVLPREGFPSVEVPVAVASGGYFVDDQALVDTDITGPAYEALADHEAVESVNTTARANSFTIVANLNEGYTSSEGAEILDAELAGLGLPPEAQWQTQAVNAAQFLNRYDLLVGITGPADADAVALEEAANAALPAFEGRGEIASVEVVELFDRGVNPQTGESVETEANFNQATQSGGDGTEFRPAVAIGVVAADEVDALAIRDVIDGVLADVEADALLDADYNAFVAVDFATQIRRQVGSLQQNVLTGLLAVAVIALLLISWRASIITAAFILTVLATSFALFALFGISLNTISLFGVILALGLFVDDSIVITEAIDAFREGAEDRLGVIGHAIRRVGSASVSGTVTTVLVFAPMLAISGILGDFVRILPLSVIIALVTSLILSLLLIPLAARYLVLSAPANRNPLVRAEDALARFVSSLPARTGTQGVLAAVFGVGLSLVMIGLAIGVLAPRVGFNIFPPAKDSTEIAVEYTFAPGTSVEDARSLALQVNQDAADALDTSLDRAFTYVGNARTAYTQFTLTDIGGRPPAPELVSERLDPIAESVDGARVVFNQLGAGPPEALFPFQVQIFGEDPAVLQAAADDVAATLQGATIERDNGTTFSVLETDIALTDVVSRRDGRRLVEVRARFDADDTTTTVTETQSFLEAEYPAERLEGLGLDDDALGFDFGLESSNQESFNSLPVAFGIALLAMLVLLVIQFRSTTQWLLVFLAIPFSLFGVFGGLLLTNNVLSFFVMLGLLGLIGIAVNNTILLTDFANQERRAGATRTEAIQTAVRRRFRPLVTTSLTTVAGVLPLALSDPFWEALGYTIIFGLLSSTFLVVLAFPYYYLGLEWLRDKVVTPWRRKPGTGGDGPAGLNEPDGSGPLVRAAR